MSVFNKPIEMVRAAPFGTIMATSTGSVSLIGALGAVENYNGQATPDIGLLFCGISILSGIISASSVKHFVVEQVDLKNRLEEIIDDRGYDERAFAVTTNEWCNRQTARVVCEKYDVLDEYESLCSGRAETAQLRFIPHI